MGVIVCNYLEQFDTSKKKIEDITGVVLVWQNNNPYLDVIAHLLKHCLGSNSITLFLSSNSLLSFYHLVQLFQITLCNVTIKLCDDDLSIFDTARNFAEEKEYLYINNNNFYQYSLLSAGTIAIEMLHPSIESSKPQSDLLIIPIRFVHLGTILVSGVSIIAKALKPSIIINVSQLDDDVVLSNSNNNNNNNNSDNERQGLFPNYFEQGWKSRITEQLHSASIFNCLDKNNSGIVTKNDFEEFLDKIINNGRNKIKFEIEQDEYNYSEFITEMNQEFYNCLEKSLNSKNNIKLINYCSLKELKRNKYIDKIIKVTEDEAAFGFLQLLLYTHTIADGKGVLPFASLFTNKIDIKNEKVIALITGGFVDVTDFQNLLEHSMGLIGNNFTLQVELLDNTNSLSKVLELLASLNVSVYDISFDRTKRRQLYHVNVNIQCLSKLPGQQENIKNKFKEEGYNIIIISASHNANTFTIPTVVINNNNNLKPTKSTEFTITNNGNNSNNNNNNNNNGIVKEIKVRSIDEVTTESIRLAYERIKGSVVRTPLYYDQAYSNMCKCQVYLKFDNIQKTGSFKARGSSNFLLKYLEEYKIKPKGLIAASAGNHAQGVALAASKVGLPCTICVPNYAPETKLTWTRQYGAEVIKVDGNLEDALDFAEKLCKERSWQFVKPFNDCDIIEGQGTIGLEVYEDLKEVDTVLVNVGGGGMIAGISIYLKKINPKIRIIGIQSELVAPLINYKQQGSLNYVPPGTSTIADGTAVRVPGGVHSKILKSLVDEYVSVSENEIASTIVHLLSSSRTLSEGAGCLGLAALLHGKIKVQPNEKVCVILCGGNVDVQTIVSIYEYGLRSLGRMLRINLTTSDAPGNLYKIISLASKYQLKVHQVHHNRGQSNISWSEVTITISFYSNSFAHQLQFLNSVVTTMNKFPEIIGRESIKEHQSIYKSFDNTVAKKQAELHKEREQKNMEYIQLQQKNSSSIL